MKKEVLILFFTFFLSSLLFSQIRINVFDEILFYDGYASLEKLSEEIEPLPQGVIRHKTSLVARKISSEDLALLGDTIMLEVVLKAACDNYDRLGHVHLALVPKGEGDYSIENPDILRIEIARFITPFMNKNKQPDTVPYIFDVSNLTELFKDHIFTSEYDYWIELEVFGVPYAANTQVAGCSGRNDVFYGSLNFITSESSSNESENNFLLKIFNKRKFNNYQEGATDELGKTMKSVRFFLEERLTDANLYLITSNHGAYATNSAAVGEEYNRRWHYVYFDEEEVLKYKPGRTSCEPFRVYNTQGNGIYGRTSMTDEQWQEFSNWCPGDVIDIRIISLRDLEAGEHSFKIEVPDALFIGEKGKGTDGNIPLSVYIQGKTEGKSSIQILSINDISLAEKNVTLYPNPVKSNFLIKSNSPVKNVTIYDITGRKVYQGNSNAINTEEFKSGVYIVHIKFLDGLLSVKKIIKQ